MKADYWWAIFWFVVGAVCSMFVTWALVEQAYSKRLHPEQYYQISWCKDNQGEVEVVLEDRTRVDCLTKTHAIEVDFANKFFEGLSQALYYGMMTGKKAGLVLIVERDTDKKYVGRAKKLIKYFSLPIDLWEVVNDD
jgi:hypothetical protein